LGDARSVHANSLKLQRIRELCARFLREGFGLCCFLKKLHFLGVNCCNLHICFKNLDMNVLRRIHKKKIQKFRLSQIRQFVFISLLLIFSLFSLNHIVFAFDWVTTPVPFGVLHSQKKWLALNGFLLYFALFRNHQALT
jgi:hypothetical protein